jgi:maltooligosyltrehalose trehalohydrolase
MISPGIEKRELGITLIPGVGARMLFWSPGAASVQTEFEGRGLFSLEKKDFGYWEGIFPEIVAGDRYMMVIDGTKKIPDPVSLSQPDGVHASSEIIDTSLFPRSPDIWKGINISDLIIYELHPGTFSPEGTFKGIAGKLDYLHDLGITAIELMPVAQFPGKRNWGYDGVYPFAVQDSYGGPQQLSELVNACHKKGIAVILDVVYNHLGPEGNYLSLAGPYFTDKYKTPWGSAVNYDDAWSDGVRNYFIENALMWFRDFDVDGLRLDAVHAIRDFGAVHFLQELAEYTERLNTMTGKRHFLIAESDLNDVRYITPLHEKGLGMDSQWCDEFHHALHARITDEKEGYYSDFGNTSHLVSSYNNAFVYDRKYSVHRKRIFGSSAAGMPGDKFIVFTQNHDQVGNRMLGERLSTLVSFETLKLAAGAMFVSPFIPMLFMGEEYGEDAPFLYFVSHGDKDLNKAVREGRKKEFADFVTDKEPPNPDLEETYNNSKLKWDFGSDDKKNKLLKFYKALIHLKKTHPALKPGNREAFSAIEAAGGEVVCLKIYFNERPGDLNGKNSKVAFEGKSDSVHENEGILKIILNFSHNSVEVAVADGLTASSQVLLYSAHERWGGDVNDFASLAMDAGKIDLDRRSMLILSDTIK